MGIHEETAPTRGLRLYRELAEWYPLLTPACDYAEEAAFYRGLISAHCRHTPRTLLDLGCGAGHNAAHLKAGLACTLLDLEPTMLDLSRRLNPECEHLEGDMRSVRLGRLFDCVLVHDAVGYMTTRADLMSAVATAFEHTAPGGVALFQPDFVAETFEPGTEAGGGEGDGRALRFLEWRWIADTGNETYVTDMAYLLRSADGTLEVAHDRHVMGLFARKVWLGLLESVGFEALTIPFNHSSNSEAGREVFLGRRPAIKGRGQS